MLNFKNHITRHPIASIVVGFAVIVAFELLVHWYMSKDYIFSSTLLQWYVYRNPQSSKGNGGYLDFLLPVIILGVLIGRVGRQWSQLKIAFFVVAIGIGISALELSYTLFLNNLIWWLPTAKGTVSDFIIQGIFWTIGLCVFVQLARRYGTNQGAKTATS